MTSTIVSVAQQPDGWSFFKLRCNNVSFDQKRFRDRSTAEVAAQTFANFHQLTYIPVNTSFVTIIRNGKLFFVSESQADGRNDLIEVFHTFYEAYAKAKQIAKVREKSFVPYFYCPK